MKVGLLGCGKMGSVIAKKLPDDMEKVIVDRNIEKLKKLSEIIKYEYSCNINSLSTCDIILVVLPENAVNQNIEEICKIAKQNSIVLNMSTNGKVDENIKAKYKNINIIETKIIGQSTMIDKFNQPCAIIIGSDDEEIIEKIKNVFKNFPYVEKGDVEKVPLAVSSATRQAIITCMDLKEKLNNLDIDKSWQEALFKTVLGGTINSFVDDTLGPFAKAIVNEIENKN